MAESSRAEPEASAAEPEPAPKRRFRRRALVLLLGLPLFALIGVSLALVFLPQIVTGERLRKEAVSALTELLGVPIQIESLEYGLFSGVVLKRLVVGPPPGFERDVLRAERVAVRYQLQPLSRTVVVDEIALEAPELVLETKNGQSNLDAILAFMAKGKPPKPKEEDAQKSEPLSGPLSPITVIVRDAHVGPLSVALVGEGPNVSLAAVMLKLSARIDPERVKAAIDLGIEPPAATSKDGPNLSLSLPAVAPAVPISASLGLRLQTRLELEGKASDGLELERLSLSNELDLRSLAARYGEAELPPARAHFAHTLQVSPAADRAALESLLLTLDGSTLLDAELHVEGLYALVAGQAGPVLANTLGAQIGLRHKAEQEDLRLALKSLSLPLAQLEPYARVFVPGLSMSGAIDVSDLRVSGRVAPAAAGRPDQITGTIGFHELKLALPSAKLEVARVDGALLLARLESGMYGLNGTLALAGIVQGPNRVPKGELGLELSLEQLAYPPPGQAAVGVRLDVEDVAVPGVSLSRAAVTLSARGQDLLSPERAADQPIETELTLSSGKLRLTQPNGKIEIAGLKLDLSASPDALLLPSRGPIPLHFVLGVPSYLDPAGNLLEQLSLDGKLQLGDPRLAYFDVKGELLLKAGLVSTPTLSLKSLVLTLTPDARRIGAHAIAGFPGGAPAKLPATVDLGLVLDTPELKSGKPEAGQIVTGVHFETQLSADPVAATARIERAKLALESWLTLRLSGQARDLYAESPAIKARLDLDKIDLAAALAHLPPSMLGEAADTQASGKLAAVVELDGRPPRAFDKLDLGALPISSKLSLSLDDLSARGQALGGAFDHLSGKLSATLASGQVGLDADLSAGAFEAGQGEERIRGGDAHFTAKVGLAERLLSSKLAAGTSKLLLGDSKEELKGVELVANLTYPLGGDVELETLELKVPVAGLFVKVWGRLSRQQFGVLKPDLAASARIDLDALHRARSALAAVPALKKALQPLEGGSGRLSTRLELTSKSETRLDVFGVLELEDFSYSMPNLELVKATGRIPVEQRLLLPPPFFDQGRAASVGALGDDLEARIDELKARLGKLKLMLVPDDILVTAPRTADHDALRPYFDKRGAELKMVKFVYKRQTFSDVHFEGAWRSGIFQIDRFQTGLWEGYFLGDLALQISPDLDVRIRARGVATKLNLDIPYAMAKGVEPEKDPSKKQDYQASGTLDLAFGLRERALNGRIDVLQLSLPQVERLFGALDPKGESPAVKALAMSDRVGVRPVAAKVWISQNLLNVQFDWRRLWVHVSYQSWNPADLFIDTVMIFARPVIGVPLLGGLYVIPLVNNAIRRVALGPFIEPVLAGMRLDATMASVQPWLVPAEDEDRGTEVAHP